MEEAKGKVSYIHLKDEIEEIKERLRQMGATFERVAPDIRNSGFEKADNPIAKHKVIRAKRRKKKRKNGGPR